MSDIKSIKALITECVADGLGNNEPASPALEYSPQFAERIIAASCGEFVEIDADDMIQMLDDMLAQARARKTDTQ